MKGCYQCGYEGVVYQTVLEGSIKHVCVDCLEEEQYESL